MFLYRPYRTRMQLLSAYDSPGQDIAAINKTDIWPLPGEDGRALQGQKNALYNYGVKRYSSGPLERYRDPVQEMSICLS